MTNIMLLKLNFMFCLAGENSIESYKKNGVRKQRSVAKRFSEENKTITLGFTGSRSEDLCITKNCKGNTVLSTIKAFEKVFGNVKYHSPQRSDGYYDVYIIDFTLGFCRCRFR